MFSCGSQKSSTEDFKEDQITINTLVAERFSNRTAKILPNNDRSYSIVSTRKKTLKMLFPTIDFFVFDHNSNTIIFEDSLAGGSVAWDSEYSLRATNRGSKTEGIEKYSYLYDCKSKKKITLE